MCLRSGACAYRAVINSQCQRERRADGNKDARGSGTTIGVSDCDCVGCIDRRFRRGSFYIAVIETGERGPLVCVSAFSAGDGCIKVRDRCRAGADKHVISNCSHCQIRCDVDNDSRLVSTTVGVCDSDRIGGVNEWFCSWCGTSGVIERGCIVPQVCVATLSARGGCTQMCNRSGTCTDQVVIHGGAHVKWRSHVDSDCCCNCTVIGIGDSDSIGCIYCRCGDGTLDCCIIE